MPGQLCHEEDGNSCLHNGSLVLEWAKSGKSVNESNKKKQRNTHTHTCTHTYIETYTGGCGTRNESLLK